MMKKRVIAATLPVNGLIPAISILAMRIESTEVVLQVDEVCNRVYTSGALKSPMCPVTVKKIPTMKKNAAK